MTCKFFRTTEKICTNIILYTDSQGKIEVEVYCADESMLMTQKQMGELFEIERNTVTHHIGEIYASGELEEWATSRKIRVVQIEGEREVARQVQHYNLDTIISVSYRVNSRQATRFRQWTTSVLHEYIQKGFALNDERFKKGYHFDEAYFNELLECIREIRLSERRMYLKLSDIFALSSDYSRKSDLAREFLLSCKTMSTLPLREEQRQRLFMIVPTAIKTIWV